MRDSPDSYSMHNYLVRREKTQTPKELAKDIGDLSVLANRIVGQVAAKIDQFGDMHPDQFPMIPIDLREFKRKDGSLFAELAAAGEELTSKKARFLCPNNGDYIITTWMTSARYTGNGQMLCRFSPEMRSVLLELGAHRTNIHLPSFMKLDGKHSQRLYELLCSYKSLGGWSIEIERFRTAMHIKPDTYREKSGDELKRTNWKNFRMRVINPAIAEINDKTDLAVEVEKENRGTRWTRFRFNVSPQIKRAEGSPKPSRKLEEWEKWIKEIEATLDHRLLWKLFRVVDPDAFKEEFLKITKGDELPDLDVMWLRVKGESLSSEIEAKYGRLIYNESKQTTFDGF